jgi:hypothetical protein
MIDNWFSTIELPLTFAQFLALPQNPAYKYEYFDGHAWLTPRPKSHHALLDAVVRALASLGYSELASTFLLGNESSTLWHWRTGFRLLSHPGSMRAIA